MNAKSSKTSHANRLSLNFTDKINLKSSDKYMLLYKILAYTIHGKI